MKLQSADQCRWTIVKQNYNLQLQPFFSSWRASLTCTALTGTGLSLVWLRNWTKPPLCLALCYNYLSIIKSGNGKIFFDIGYRKHQMRSKTRTQCSKVWFGPKNDGANETQSLLSSGSEVLLAFIFYILGSSTIILHRNI